MSLPVRLRRVAQREYDDAVDWYEARSPGLGGQFLAALRQKLDEIAGNPDRYPEVWPGVREAPLTKWPYCVYYQVHPDHVMVIAVFHSARDPSVWQSRA
jgi:plasmid stabilization system protein ParE